MSALFRSEREYLLYAPFLWTKIDSAGKALASTLYRSIDPKHGVTTPMGYGSYRKRASRNDSTDELLLGGLERSHHHMQLQSVLHWEDFADFEVFAQLLPPPFQPLLDQVGVASVRVVLLGGTGVDHEVTD